MSDDLFFFFFFPFLIGNNVNQGQERYNTSIVLLVHFISFLPIVNRAKTKLEHFSCGL